MRGPRGQAIFPSKLDASAFCAEVANAIPRLSRWWMGRFDDRVTQAQVARSISQGGSLIILDLNAHTLDVAEMNCSAAVAASGSPVQFTVSRLEPERVYQFSGEATPCGDIPLLALRDFRGWAAGEIAAVAERVNREYPHPVIGALGASVEVTGGTWVRQTVFDDVDALMTGVGFPR